ncbi:peptidoglycan-binding protein [Nostoc sp. TCL26-01]|uniref:peptidoglycan-binding protein n=1 Tax=Nostoc sp. TCL26-01 TaxID=2576904 RepID=UPI0015BD3100|nr:peptidoglycan-binding protein [Nostoc sp. TCL26-01]QLE54488.1 CHAP domain-containing protein [Nostoc sp. TCL26-01]
MPLNAQLKAKYQQLYQDCAIKSDKISQVDTTINRIIENRTRYKKVERVTDVPWFIIAVLHHLEGSGNFNTHLHNGDPLSTKTTHVPKNRPLGEPPFTWEESAQDALTFDGLNNWRDWSIPGICYTLENFNGTGYRRYHSNVKSPYLWSFSDHYTQGKYRSDGQFDPNLVSQQCGGMVILKRMEEKNLISLSPQDNIGDNIDTTTPEEQVTWFALYRQEKDGTSYPVIAANAGSKTIEVVEFTNKLTDDLVDFLGKYPTAKTFLVAASSSSIPAATAADITITPNPTLPKLTRILRWGTKGDDVKALQQVLNNLGFNAGDIDGEFENDTEEAVKAFQLKAGLMVDGEVGPMTWGKLGGDYDPDFSTDPSDSINLQLASFAEIEAAKGLTWVNASSEAEKYLAPFRQPMQLLDHIGTAPDFYNWCAAFVAYCCRQVGIDIPDQPQGFWATMALVETWQFWAKQNGYWYSQGSVIPMRGDIVTFDWPDSDAPGDFNHIGIIRAHSQGSTVIKTSEGNRRNTSGNFTRYLSSVSGIIRIR